MQFNGLVEENTEVMPGVYLLTMEVPGSVSTPARPGQFLHVLCSDSYDPLLRRPLSLHKIEAGTSHLSVLYQVVGRGTDWLSRRLPGQAVNCLGPLGNGFVWQSSTRRLLLVGGGIGQAPLVAAADEAVRRGISVVFAAGARNESGLLPVQALPAEVEYRVTTEDGSAGQRGLVTDMLADLLDWPDQVFACGPEAMYRRMLADLRMRGVRKGLVQVSLEERMACGVGACYSCVAETNRGLRKVCKDGPVFLLMEVAL